MTDLDQLVFDLDVEAVPATKTTNPRGRPGTGSAGLLRRLVAIGLDPEAVVHAAALVAALDEEAA
jgi:hypothetical protein